VWDAFTNTLESVVKLRSTTRVTQPCYDNADRLRCDRWKTDSPS